MSGCLVVLPVSVEKYATRECFVVVDVIVDGGVDKVDHVIRLSLQLDRQNHTHLDTPSPHTLTASVRQVFRREGVTGSKRS